MNLQVAVAKPENINLAVPLRLEVVLRGLIIMGF